MAPDGCLRSLTRRRSLLLLGATALAALSPPALPARRGPQSQRELLGAAVSEPLVYLLASAALVAARQRIAASSGDPQEIEQLRDAADRALGDGPFSVTTKTAPSPSGDPHDYVSLSLYYWPNPDTADGLPYILQDGHINPEAREPAYDAISLQRMVSSVNLLALAYYLLEDLRYADRAELLLHSWFLDSATRMNPTMQYSQIIPGRPVPDSGIGIIEAMPLMAVVDAVGLLAGSPSWSSDDAVGLQSWFSHLLDWLQNSGPGQREAARPNNHGSWYAAQAADYAIFTGQTDVAAGLLGSAGPQRIASQIEPDGSQPLELARTRAFHYSVFNLEALSVMAALGDSVGVDLWNYQSADGRSIRAALDFLLPYAQGTAAWPYPDLETAPPSDLAWVLQRAGSAYPDGGYQPTLEQLFPPATPLQSLGLSVAAWPPNPRLMPPAAHAFG